MKPEIAKHEGLFAAEQETGYPLRFAWAILPTACDREGRFKWRPGSMKTDLLPYDILDFADVLNELLRRGFLLKYRHGVEWYGLIPTFTKHQVVNNRESASDLPGLDGADEVISHDANGFDASATRDLLDEHAGQGEGKGREGKGTGRSTSPELPASPTVLEFPTVGTGGPVWRLREAQIAEWEGLFPNVDVRQESRQALAWVLANPGRRKTVRGMPAFLVGWFSRSANRGGRPAAPTDRPRGGWQPSTGPRWFCPHVDRCCGGNQTACTVALMGDPDGSKKWPLRPGVVFELDEDGVPREPAKAGAR